ncbi:MAG: hypothetical protein H6Q21_2166 [Bacteroidetes bacterium]|nr:hypothetical protein [Bacteroidota bacterium]
MKKATLLFWMTIIYAGIVIGQDPEPVKPCVFVNNEGKIYYNRTLPVYFWISGSPEENAPAYRLTSDSSKKYTNPMYWDCEGEHTVYLPRAVDTLLKQSANPQAKVVYHVVADSKSPVTHARLSGKSLITRNEVNFYSGKLTVALSAKDATSGISSTYISLNGKPFEKYTGPLTAEADGEYFFAYYSVDIVGNQEEKKTGKFTLDNGAPVTSYSFEGLEDNRIGSKTTLVLKSSDGLSGVQAIYYRMNQGPETLYTRPISASRLADGKSSISFYAVDNLSNREKPQTVTGELK